LPGLSACHVRTLAGFAPDSAEHGSAAWAGGSGGEVRRPRGAVRSWISREAQRLERQEEGRDILAELKREGRAILERQAADGAAGA